MNLDVPRLLQGLGIAYQQKGNRLWARCPSAAHPDQDPSWSIWHAPGTARNGKHKCFGCGFGGSPSWLVAEVLGMTSREAEAWLEEGGLDLPLLEVELVFRQPNGPPAAMPRGVVLGEPLERWPTVFRRAAEQRLLDDRMVRRWGLGYAQAGRLRGRLVIPVRDRDGGVVAYQARTVLGGGQARYLDPPGARPFVFGQEHWPSMDVRRRVVVVEGPFDALAVDQATGLPVGALLGSEVHPRQLLALSTFSHVTVMVDPDQAGSKAAQQLESLARHVRLGRVVLPPGEDPDSLRPRTVLAELLGVTA